MKHIIKTTDLSKQFRLRGNTNIVSGLFSPNWQYKDAVKGVNLVIEAGESVAFLGPNGAGKTTTTKMLTGLMKPTSGEARVLGYEPFSRNDAFLQRIGLVMGNKAGLNWDLTATQSFELLQKIYDVPIHRYQNRVTELSDLLQVKHVLGRQVRKLSLGERMKLELMAALLHDPEVLFLDEPTIGLDINSKHNVREFLRQMHKKGKTILLTSHDMDDVSEVCNRVVVINNGIIMFDGSMGSINKQYSDKKFVKLEFEGMAPNKNILEQYGGVISINKNNVTLSVGKDEVMDVVSKINASSVVRDITIEAVPLEVIVSDLFKKG